MIRKASTIFCFLLLLATRSSSITSGWPAQDKDFPSVVQIWTLDANKPRYLCTGVVIAPDTVLTTASCIYTKDRTSKATTLFVSTTSQLDFTLPLTQALQHLSSVALKGIVHPENDLMLIFLKQRINVEPALLLSAAEAFPLRTLSQVFVAGYGVTGEEPKKTGIVNTLRSWITSEKPKQPGEKMVAKSQIARVEAKDLFIGSGPEDGVACLGDEGAPIFAHIETPFRNSQRLVGLFVSTAGLSSCGKPSQALRLDAFRTFIHDTMVRECHKKTRTWCTIEGLLVPGYDEDPHTQTPPPADEKEDVSDAKEESPPAEPVVSPAPDTNTTPPTQTPPVPKTPKRRLSVAAEGAGCSCQQVRPRA